MLTPTAIRALAALAASALIVGPAVAGDENAEKQAAEKAEKNAAQTTASDEAARAADAAAVLTAATTAGDDAIPESLLQQAHAIAVIPNVVKAAVLVGGKYGKGVVAERKADGDWGSPAFVSVGGASFGYQAGVESVDLVLVFTSEDALAALLEDEIELGATVEVAAGPVGRAAEIGTNVTFDAPIYSYSQAQGVFAGASLQGVVVRLDDEANTAVYGKNPMIPEILLGNVEAPEDVQAFVEVLPQTKTSAES